MGMKKKAWIYQPLQEIDDKLVKTNVSERRESEATVE